VFGPQHRVTKKALFEAWERWAIEEGADAGTQTSFTRLISERAKTLNVESKKAKSGPRFWAGIGLRTGDPDPSDDRLGTTEIPAKEQKIEESPQFDENFSEVQSLPPIRGTSEKIDENLGTRAPAGDLPSTFEVNGYKVRFHGGEE
jgi:hypothetical protein